MPATILIVDDEQDIRLSLRGVLEDEGYAVREAESGAQCLGMLEKGVPPDLVFLDIWLGDSDGMKILPQIKAMRPDLPVVMITGHGTVENAVAAIRMGAHDFIEKPLSLDKILLVAGHALELGTLRKENTALKAALADGDAGPTGNSAVMRAFKQDLLAVAPTDAWVLLTGENGTGKEVAARALHKASRRSKAKFVAVNCAAIPEELIESELFGHEKGAFTGAVAAKAGKFEMADGGTLFLDEIGDMSMKTQAKILRILQEQRFERVGGNRTIKVDVRVIAATNKDLEHAIEENTFRRDLYYRLRVFPLRLPPLRERSGDIPLLIDAMRPGIEKKYGAVLPRFSAGAMGVLNAWAWPGNVRELEHLLERMIILHPGGTVTPEMLPPEMLPDGYAAKREGSVLGELLAMDYKNAKNSFEVYYLRKKLEETGGNISKLAELVGLERSNIHRKLKSDKSPEGDAPPLPPA